VNRLGEILEQIGMTQKELADKIGVDPPMISKFCNGHCNPTPDDARKISQAVGQPLERIWHASDLDYGIIRIEREISVEAIARTPGAKVYGVVTQHIETGRENAKTRRELMELTGMSDRKVRECIADAIYDGILIINLDKGYFIPNTIDDVRQWYYRELHRSASNFKKLSIARRILDEYAIAMSGQIRFNLCIRCGIESESGLCDTCRLILKQRETASALQ
jgi:transcriptional regulator with XRE-family HTH domain